MAKTTDDLILEVLDIVGAAAAGQTPPAEDREKVEQSVTPLLEQLARMQVVYIPNPDAIDESVFLPLAMRLALQIGPKFGLPAMTPDQRRAADSEIRIVQASTQTSQPLRVEYF